MSSQAEDRAEPAGGSVRITQRVVDGAGPSGRRYSLSDTELRGFRLLVHPNGRKSFHFRYRVGGGRGATTREPKIGDAASMKCERARSIAREWAAEVAQGGDPGGARKAYREAPTMAHLFERYLEEHARPNKKASSLAEDERLIRDYLLPAFAKQKVAELKRADIASFHRSLAHKPYRANRSLALLSKALNLAELWDMRQGGSNPCRHIQKYAEKARKRYLSPAELARLGETLRAAERDGFLQTNTARTPISTWAVAAVRLLIFTGARKSEILGMRWEWIDGAAGRAHLPDSKTGEKTIVLPPPALAVLAALPRAADNPHVIQGAKRGAHLVNLKDPWLAIREAAELEGVRVHDLRHSFASVGAAGGASLHIIGGLLGHAQTATTHRYAHLSDDPLQATAADISEKIAAAMDGSHSNEIVRLKP